MNVPRNDSRPERGRNDRPSSSMGGSRNDSRPERAVPNQGREDRSSRDMNVPRNDSRPGPHAERGPAQGPQGHGNPPARGNENSQKPNSKPDKDHGGPHGR